MRPSAVLRLIASVAVGTVLLTGCGFQPLYGNPRTVAQLERTEVEVGQGRTPFLVREQLLDQLAHDRGTPPLYHVRLEVQQNRAPLGARVNNIANRYELGMRVTYFLTEIATGKLVKRNTLVLQVSYDSPDPPYAGLQAEQNAEERAAAQAAVLLRLDLARYFTGLK